MIGEHKLTLHETNTRVFVPVCSCGWVGLNHAVPVTQRKRGGRRRRWPASARAAATVEHAKHVERCVRPPVDRMNP